MNTIGIDDNLDRPRIKKLLIIGLFGCMLTGAVPTLLVSFLLGANTAIGGGIGTMFLSVGNAVTFGGLLATLPSEERFAEFRSKLVAPA